YLLGREAAGERGAMERAAAAVVLEKHAARRFVRRHAARPHAGARWVLWVVVGIALVEPQGRVAELGVEDRRDLVAPRQDGGFLEEIDVAAVLAARIEEQTVALVAAATVVPHAVGREPAEKDLLLDALKPTGGAGQVEKFGIYGHEPSRL